jgi:hypothetical protein
MREAGVHQNTVRFGDLRISRLAEILNPASLASITKRAKCVNLTEHNHSLTVVAQKAGVDSTQVTEPRASASGACDEVRLIGSINRKQGERAMTTIISGILTGCYIAFMLNGHLMAQQQVPQKTSVTTKGASSSTTEQLHGTVEYVEGKTLVVKMASGDVRTFTPPESRRFIIDGQQLTVRDLKPGTKLTATVTTTSTPVTERTTTIGEGTVWFVSGQNVILTLPNGENRQYEVKSDYKFIVNGMPATVSDLKKGMVVKAEKIVETPHVEIATDTRVTGTRAR